MDKALTQQKGFTLIEMMAAAALIAVVVMYAIPRFIHLSKSAQESAVTALASALTAANASNYAARKIDTRLGMQISDCTDMSNVLLGGVPANYHITANTAGIDTSVACKLIGPHSTSAIFTVTGIN